MRDDDYDYDRDPVLDLADVITGWQQAALSLPLAEVNDTACKLANHLGCILQTFNQVRRDHSAALADDDALARTVGDVVQQATAAAIYAHAATWRRRQAAAYS